MNVNPKTVRDSIEASLKKMKISLSCPPNADVTKELREKELGNLEAIFSKTKSTE